MNLRLWLLGFGLVASASTQLWCAPSDPAAPPPPADEDGGQDSGDPADATRAEAEAEAEAPNRDCTDAFCRVALPGVSAVVLDAVLARSTSEVWVAGSTGFAARFDGSSWRRIQTGVKSRIFSLASTSDGTVWGASGGHEFLQLNRENDGGVETVDGGFKGAVESISAFGAELYAVGTMAKSPFWPPPPPDNIWRYAADPDGGSPAWSAVSPKCPLKGSEAECLPLHAVWAESASRQWFAGDDGKIFRTEPNLDPRDTRLRLVDTNSNSLRRFNGLWGFGSDDVWAVGVQGIVRHFTGGEEWTVVPSPVVSDLRSVWGASPDDVWAVGDDATVIHWDGARWTVKDVPLASDDRPRLLAVAGVGDDVWIAGETTLLRSRKPGLDR